MVFDPKEFGDPQVFDDPKGISIGRMDFNDSKVYSDTSIFDGLVFGEIISSDSEFSNSDSHDRLFDLNDEIQCLDKPLALHLLSPPQLSF